MYVESLFLRPKCHITRTGHHLIMNNARGSYERMIVFVLRPRLLELLDALISLVYDETHISDIFVQGMLGKIRFVLI